LAVDERVSTSGVDGQVLSLHGVDETNDVMVDQEENMETKMGRGMRKKTPSTMYKNFCHSCH